MLLGMLRNGKPEFLKFSSLFWNFIKLGKEVRLNPNCSHPLTYPPCLLPGKIFWKVEVAFLNGFVNLIQFLADEWSGVAGRSMVWEGVVGCCVCLEEMDVSSWIPSFTVFIPAFPWPLISPGCSTPSLLVPPESPPEFQLLSKK